VINYYFPLISKINILRLNTSFSFISYLFAKAIVGPNDIIDVELMPKYNTI